MDPTRDELQFSCGCSRPRRPARPTMKASEVPRAVAAAVAAAAALGLRVDDAAVLHNSNRLAVRLLPCDVLARVAPGAHQAAAQIELAVVRLLAQSDSPVAAP